MTIFASSRALPMFEPTLDREQLLRAANAFAARMFPSGVSAADTLSLLMKGGLDHQTAASVVNTASQEYSHARRRTRIRKMLIGAISWPIGGFAIRILTWHDPDSLVIPLIVVAAIGSGGFLVANGAYHYYASFRPDLVD